LRVIPASRSDTTGKLQSVVAAFPRAWDGSVLDVGCRSQELRSLLGDASRYCGIDLKPPADIRADLESGLPVSNRSFHVVIALDVLEHTEDIHAAFAELCRVADRSVIVSLPNLYKFKARVRFLLGRPVSGKYGLPPETVTDRHRWLFTLGEAAAFVRGLAAVHGFKLEDEAYMAGPRRSAPLARRLVGTYPSVFAESYLAHLRRAGGP